MTLDDYKLYTLHKEGYKGTLADVTKQWLMYELGITDGTKYSVHDLERMFLLASEGNGNSLNDVWKIFYTRWLTFWG